MIFYKFFMGDYQRDTRRLSWDEDLAYRRLLDEYYATEEPIPLDLDEVFNIVQAHTKNQKNAVKKVLTRFFEKSPSGYRNAKADLMIQEAASKSEKQRAKAKKRWEKATAASTKAMPQHSHSVTSQTPKPKAKPKVENFVSQNGGNGKGNGLSVEAIVESDAQERKQELRRQFEQIQKGGI